MKNEFVRFRGEPARPARPVEVLYIIDTLWGVGGAELSLARLLRALPNDRFGSRVVTFYSNEAGRALIESSGSKVYHWPLRNLYSPRALSVAHRIVKMVREERIDIVHTFFQTSDLWAGPLAKLSGAGFLISSRRDMGILRQPKHRRGYRLVSSVFDQVHAVSESVRRYTIEVDGVAPSRVLTIHNGVRTEGITPATPAEIAALRNATGVEPHKIVISTVANFREVKGIDTLVRAAVIVASRAPEVRFLVAGEFGKSAADAAYTQSVLKLASSLGTERFLMFLGPVNHVRPLLQFSDVFVLPSRSEGLSNALLEAMQAALPCVATSVGGNPEVVVDGVTGFLVPPDNPEPMASRILDLVKDAAFRVHLGQAGHARVLQSFSAGAMTAKVIHAYEEAVIGLRRTNRKMAADPISGADC